MLLKKRLNKELEYRKREINKKISNDDDDVNEDEIVDSHLTALEEIKRSDEEDWQEYAHLRKIKIYDGTIPKLTEFFSSFKPNVLLGALVNFVRQKKIEFKAYDDQYKAIVQMPSEEENIVDFVVEIQKVKENSKEDVGSLVDSDDEDCLEDVDENASSSQKYWVSFRKKKGPLADFIQIYRNFRLFWGQLNDTEKSCEEEQDQ